MPRGRKPKNWDDYPPPIRDRVSGCLLWQGPLHTAGYGKVGSKGYAHRVAYERAYGPIPESHQVDHVADRGCTHRHCVEPEHLEAVTQAENIRRQPNVVRQMAATHCPKGHEYTEANTYVRKRGNGVKRECLRCHYDRVNDYKRRRRAAKKVGLL